MGFFNTLGSGLAAESLAAGSSFLEDFLDTDPTLGTCAPSEANIRNQVTFATLRLSFPTTATGAKLSLPAYLTAFSENFTPQWTSTPVFGRADPIPVYKNTSRSTSLGFLIPCYNSNDANENLKKLNMLIKSLYPGYTKLKKTGAVVLSSPPLIRVKFANLLVNHKNPYKGLLGYITSFSTDFGINNRGVFMDRSSIPGRGALFPRAFQFNFSFSPLHESIVGWDNDESGGKFFGSRDYPYRTKMSPGDVIQAGASTVTNALGAGGLGEKVQFSEILGWAG